MRRSPMMMRMVVAAMILSAATEARAGACLGEDEIVGEIVQLEAYAKDPKATIDGYLCVRVAFGDDDDIVPAAHRKKLQARIEKACTTILTRDHTDAECIELAVWLGKKSLGGVTLFDVVSKYKIDIWSWDRWTPMLWMLGQLGDPRGAPIIRDAWTAAIEVAAKYEKAHRHGDMQAWAGWRKEAAETLGMLGVAADKTFLEEQAAATKDRYVKQSCLDAAKAIEHRLSLATPPAARP